MKRYATKPRLWLGLSAGVFIVLSVLPAIPGIPGSRVGECLVSLIGAPFLMLMSPSTGADALTDGVVGLAFFVSIALSVGWFLHCTVVCVADILWKRARREPNQSRQPTPAPPRLSTP